MSYLLETREIGDYRISVYQDEDAGCPVSEWDMAGLFIWDDGGCGWSGHRISQSSNWEELFGKFDDGNHTMCEALRELVYKYVSQEKVIDYIKSDNCKDYRMRYDRIAHMWYVDILSHGRWCGYFEYTPSDLKNEDCRDSLCEILEYDDLIYLLHDCKYIAFYEWSSYGYCQGDYARGIAWSDEERYRKMCCTDTTDWRNRALKLFEGEAEDIGHWLWGDVKGYVLEKKVPYKKVFTEIGRESEDAYDWEEIDSCWGEYMETDELIEEVIKENGLDKKDAA